MKEKLISIKDKFFGKIKSLNEKRNLNTEKYSKLNTFLMLFFPFFICAMAEINQGKYITSFLSFLVDRPLVMLFNILIAGLIFAMFLAIFRKGWIAVAVESFIYMTLSTTELFKYNTNGNHLILSELRLARNVKSLTSFAYIKITPELIFYIAIVVAFAAAVFYFNPKIKLRPVKRICTSLACVVPCAALVLSPSFAAPVYAFFSIDTTDASNQFLLNQKFENNSLLAFLVETATESYETRIVEPDNYTEESVDTITDVDVEDNNVYFNGGEKPNVIVIMSESFADFRAFDELDVDDSYYAGFDQAVSEGFGGTAITPTFASYTVRSEFELIFGLPIKGINDPSMPQRELADREQPALAQYYSEWGYKTAYIHPFTKTFYSRDRVYGTFGFDQMIFHDEEVSEFTVPVDYFGTYVDDTTIFNQIGKLITDTDEPMYIHTTTMQNHQPYDQGEDPNDEFNNYLQWIQHTTDGIPVFLDMLKKIDEPTLVFFVGDHFPSLRGETSVYNEVGINAQNCDVVYKQPYFFWSNYDADYSSVPDKELSFFYIPYVIMNIIDAPRDEFIQTMNDYMETLPVYSTGYDPESPANEELDLLTYDRVVGEVMSPCPIPEETLNAEID